MTDALIVVLMLVGIVGVFLNDEHHSKEWR